MLFGELVKWGIGQVRGGWCLWMDHLRLRDEFFRLSFPVVCGWVFWWARQAGRKFPIRSSGGHRLLLVYSRIATGEEYWMRGCMPRSGRSESCDKLAISGELLIIFSSSLSPTTRNIRPRSQLSFFSIKHVVSCRSSDLSGPQESRCQRLCDFRGGQSIQESCSNE